MTRYTRFKDSFWDVDILSSHGFDALSRRMKDGKRLYQDVEHFLRQRSKIETQYYKELQKLSENSKFKTEFGTIDMSWKEMKSETDKIAQIHEKVAAEYDKLASELASLNEEQKREVKLGEDMIHRSHNTLKNLYNKYTNQEKVYNQKCEDWERANYACKYYETASLNVSQKEREKNKIKELKCKEDMDRNEKLYKQTVEEVQKAKAVFETDMEDLSVHFQELDEKRIDHLREALWKSTNIDSQACVDRDDCCERVRLSLEKCSIEKDIADYIANYRTGSKRPPNIFFKSYFHRSKPLPDSTEQSRRRLPSVTNVYDEIKDFGLSETEDVESTSEIEDVESTSETEDVESTSETEDVESTSETEDVESTSETEDVESTSETEDVESTSETEDVESTSIF